MGEDNIAERIDEVSDADILLSIVIYDVDREVRLRGIDRKALLFDRWREADKQQNEYEGLEARTQFSSRAE